MRDQGFTYQNRISLVIFPLTYIFCYELCFQIPLNENESTAVLWPLTFCGDRCRTIALETGAQNVHLCTTVLQLSFSPEELVHMFTFPLIYGSSQLISCLLLVTGENCIYTAIVDGTYFMWPIYQLRRSVLKLSCSVVLQERYRLTFDTIINIFNTSAVSCHF